MLVRGLFWCWTLLLAGAKDGLGVVIGILFLLVRKVEGVWDGTEGEIDQLISTSNFHGSRWEERSFEKNAFNFEVM